MCLESVAHVLVMLNFSSTFLIYCSVSNQFKAALSKICLLFCHRSLKKSVVIDHKNIPKQVIVEIDKALTIELEEINKKTNNSKDSDEDISAPSSSEIPLNGTSTEVLVWLS